MGVDGFPVDTGITRTTRSLSIARTTWRSSRTSVLFPGPPRRDRRRPGGGLKPSQGLGAEHTVAGQALPFLEREYGRLRLGAVQAIRVSGEKEPERHQAALGGQQARDGGTRRRHRDFPSGDGGTLEALYGDRQRRDKAGEHPVGDPTVDEELDLVDAIEPGGRTNELGQPGVEALGVAEGED